MKRIEFICSQCKKDIVHDIDGAESTVCDNCQHVTTLALSPELIRGDQIESCAVCQNRELYLQKDFNPRLGIFIFAIGVLFSYHTMFISLFVATAIDFVLYYVLPTVAICYQCRAIYRGFKPKPDQKGFDHLTALKHSQAAT